MRPNLLLLGIVLILTTATLGCAVSQDEAEQADIDIADLPVEVRVTASRLAEDYEDNAVAANQKYDGKVLQVTGTVFAVSGGQEGSAYYVDLSTSGFLDTVRCYFGESRLDEFTAIKKNDRVTLRGKGDEGEDRDPFTIDVVGCRIDSRPQVATPTPEPVSPTPTPTPQETAPLPATPTPEPAPTLTPQSQDPASTPTPEPAPTLTPQPQDFASTPTPEPALTLTPEPQDSDLVATPTPEPALEPTPTTASTPAADSAETQG